MPIGRLGIYCAAAAPWTVERPLWIAALSTAGVVSHVSAASVWGLDVPSDYRAHVSVWDRRRTLAPADVVVHRVSLRPEVVTHRSGLPVTTLRRTIVDCLGTLGPASARRLADRALQQRQISAEDLRRRLCDEPKRWGNGQIRTLHDELCGASAESERILHALLRTAGLAGWRPNLAVSISGARYEIDVAFESVMVAVEVDGWAHHSTPERFRADRRKQNALILAGWTVLRFTWADLVERPEYVVSTVVAAVNGKFGNVSSA